MHYYIVFYRVSDSHQKTFETFEAAREFALMVGGFIHRFKDGFNLGLDGPHDQNGAIA